MGAKTLVTTRPRFDIEHFTVFTQAEVAELLDLHTQEIQRTEKRALNKLWHRREVRQLFAEHFGKEVRL